MTDLRDALLLRQLPVVPVPRYGAFAPLDRIGQRLLVARNGIFLEVRRAWLYAVQRSGCSERSLTLPFGTITATVKMSFGSLPRSLVQDFIGLARQAMPNELAGIVTHRESSGSLALRICESLNSSPASVAYRIPTLERDEQIVVDIHSHGALPAGFSSTDDNDDKGATKFSVVVGRLDRATPEVAARLCLNGLLIPIELGQDKDWFDETNSAL